MTMMTMSHNIVDPFEDTESHVLIADDADPEESQHRRSVRGY